MVRAKHSIAPPTTTSKRSARKFIGTGSHTPHTHQPAHPGLQRALHRVVRTDVIVIALKTNHMACVHTSLSPAPTCRLVFPSATSSPHVCVYTHRGSGPSDSLSTARGNPAGSTGHTARCLQATARSWPPELEHNTSRTRLCMMTAFSWGRPGGHRRAPMARKVIASAHNLHINKPHRPAASHYDLPV